MNSGDATWYISTHNIGGEITRALASQDFVPQFSSVSLFRTLLGDCKDKTI